MSVDKTKMSIEDMKSRMDRIIDWVKTCDTKASIMLALVGVFISFVFTSDFVLNKLDEIFKSFREYNFHNASICDVDLWGFFTVVFLLLSLYRLFGSIYRFILVVYSKHKETLSNSSIENWFVKVLNVLFRYKFVDQSDPNTRKESLISLNHIAELDYGLFKSEILSEQYHAIEEDDYLSQIYINARRCKEKFEDFNAAIRWMLRAMPWMVLFFAFLLFY